MIAIPPSNAIPIRIRSPCRQALTGRRGGRSTCVVTQSLAASGFAPCGYNISVRYILCSGICYPETGPFLDEPFPRYREYLTAPHWRGAYRALRMIAKLMPVFGFPGIAAEQRANRNG